MILDCLPILSAYGVTPLLHKHILGHISAEGVIFTSSIFYFVMVLVLYFAFFRDRIDSDLSIMNKKPYLYGLVALYGAILLFICEYLYFKVLHKHKASMVTAIVAAYPLVTLILAFLLFQEKLEYIHILGVIFVITGVIMIVWDR
jgi:drug/metabolite transporter (DMT)-like permease